ncbi:putative pyridoxal kinase [Helianthus annuus]|nr:putative pyridoxal kinase [Helianthus annuus]
MFLIGYVGNKSAVFPLQLLGYDVDPIMSVQFSNHTGKLLRYPTFKGQVLNGKQLWELIEGLEANNLLYYTHLLTVCDPVLGDEGKLYVPQELVSVYREKVVPVASMLTPNQFEAEQLTGFRIASEQDGREACRHLHAAGPSKVLSRAVNELNEHEQDLVRVRLLRNICVREPFTNTYRTRFYVRVRLLRK